jgi:hypothetical protein
VPPYVIDASTWIRLWRNHPPDIFGHLWEQLDASVAAGEVISPEEALRELERGSDDLAETLAGRSGLAGLFAPLDEALMAAVSTVLTVLPDLVDENSERNRADPFVVALARLRGGTVVTDERFRRGPTGRPRIPDACAHLGIECLDWFGFLRAVGWRL